jgi:hypothetical protein
VNVGLSFEGADTTVSIEPSAIQLVLDAVAGKALLSLSVPVEAIGLDQAALAPLGLSSRTIDVDLLFDADALYVRTPLAAAFLPMLLGQIGAAPEGDYAGWLRLGTKEDLGALEAMMRALPAAGMASTTPDLAGLSSLGPAELKQHLEASGVTFTHVGTENRGGVEAEHLSLAIDFARAAADPPFGMDGPQFADMARLGLAVTTDMWLETSTGRLVELATHATSADAALRSFDVTLTFSEPDPSISFDAPASFVDVPVVTLLGELFETFGLGGFTP